MKKYQKPSKDQIQKSLTPEQYQVTQKAGTERPFKNQYWNNHEAGIYVDVVTGEPLFSSLDKFDSGTGWPSFTQPLEKSNITEKSDHALFEERTEVRSKEGDSHLGHLFSDGPTEKGGLRYCINSAALKFIPASKLKESGYEEYLTLFVTSAKLAHGSKLIRTRSAPKIFPKTERASFAAGCFWGVEQEFRKQKGVMATAVGYMGGHTKNPSYKEVCDDHTGHAEAVQVEYDPKVISYEGLLDIFWHLHDPTTANRQGLDVGDQYRSVIFFHTLAQKKLALASRDLLQSSGELNGKIVTEIVSAPEFYSAEEYHQQYVEKGGHAACHIRLGRKK